MRFSRFAFAVATVLSFGVSTEALAQRQSGTQAFERGPDGRPLSRSGWFEGNSTTFGVPDERGKIGTFPKIGRRLEGSVYRRQGTAGPCEGSVGVGNIEFEGSAEIGINTTSGAGSGSWRGGRGATRPSGRFNGVRQNGGFNGGGQGPRGIIQCRVGVEANLISLQGQCETVAGTFAGSVKGVGGNAECGCNGCWAEAYWAKIGGDYTTPAIGGCGLKVSGTVGGELMAGGAIGAGRAGDVGAQVKFGPFGVKAGINIEEFNTGKMVECLENAGRWIRDRAVAIRDGALDLGRRAVNKLKSAGCAIASLWGGCDDDDDDDRRPPPPTSGNDWTPGGTTFSGGAFNSPGISILLGTYSTTTGAQVNSILSTGTITNIKGADGAGTARE